jgi:hypothetical protein
VQTLDSRFRSGRPCRIAALSGSSRIRNFVPVALANRSSVRVEGFVRPLSGRATTACVVPIRSATCSCVRLAFARARMNGSASANSSSSASSRRLRRTSGAPAPTCSISGWRSRRAIQPPTVSTYASRGRWPRHHVPRQTNLILRPRLAISPRSPGRPITRVRRSRRLR